MEKKGGGVGAEEGRNPHLKKQPHFCAPQSTYYFSK